MESFLAALLVVLSLPWAVWRVMGRPSWAPLVVVQILTGILLGPGILGRLAPDLQAALFGGQVLGALTGLAVWGVTLFVWFAGLELELGEALARRRETGLVAGLALAVPLALGTAVAGFLVMTPGWTGPEAAAWQAALGIGMACAVTALPILVLFLDQLGLLNRPIGQRVLRYASLDDAAIWIVLAAILLDGERLGRQIGFLCAFALAAWAMRRLVPRLAPADRMPLALIWLAALALAADWAGLHFMVGAFLAGAVLEADWLDRARIAQLRHSVLTLIMPVFFLSTGLRTGWEMGGAGVFVAAALLLVASVGGKLLGVALAGRLLGWQKGEVWVIGWLLQTKALIMIIFATILLDRGVLSEAAFTALLLMALGSTMLTMPMVGRRIGTLPAD